MKSLLVQLDENTFRALNKIAPPRKRARSAFIREAIRKAIRAMEFEQMRQAYQRQPDSGEELSDWSTFEEYNP